MESTQISQRSIADVTGDWPLTTHVAFAAEYIQSFVFLFLDGLDRFEEKWRYTYRFELFSFLCLLQKLFGIDTSAA